MPAEFAFEFPEDMTSAQREFFRSEMEVNQLLIACMTLVGNADNLIAGRMALVEFVKTLSPIETLKLFCAAIETATLNVAMQTSDSEEFNDVLQHIGTLMAHLAEGES